MKISVLSAAGLLLLTGFLADAAAQAPPAGAPADAGGGEPWISISRLGPIELEGERRIVLTEAMAELAGEVWNYGPEDELAILFKPLGRGPWRIAATSEPEPGGFFQISGIRFPDLGDYELVAGLFRRGDLAPGGRVAEERWRTASRAVSRRLLVRVTALPPPLEEERPALAVLAVGGVSVDPRQVTPVPARGEIVLRAQGLSPGTRVYLAILAPYSDRCYLHGPARPGAQRDRYVLQGISLEVPGDPRQGHLELIALASPEPLAAGPMSFQFFRRRNVLTSPTADVVVDERWAATNSGWVPYLAITRIGRQELDPVKPQKQPLAVEQGDPVEIGQSERAPEGAKPSVLTRLRGSRFWLAQGPALLRGSRGGDDPGQGPPEATWVLPSVRFENPEQTGEATGWGTPAKGEFEVMAVLSTGSLPGTWIDSAALASGFIHSLSPPVVVRVRPAEPLPKPEISISRVGGEDVSPEDETAVGATELVEIAARSDLPPPWRVYVARHPMGSSLWTLSETVPRGKERVVPALSFTNPHAEEGTRYQLMAVVIPGLLPAEQLEYDELVRSAVAFSEVVTVRYETGGLGGFKSRLARWWAPEAPPAREGRGPSEPSPKEEWNMSWIWILLCCALAFLVILIFLEHRWGTMAPLARGAANRTESCRRSVQSWFEPLPKINPASFLLGMVILALVVYTIVFRYLQLYAEAVAVVLDLSPRESSGLALWLILLTALAGTFLELASEPAAPTTPPAAPGPRPRAPHRDSEDHWLMRPVLGLAVGFLMIFQAALYFTFLSRTAGMLLAALGGFAFLLIALVEAIAFFYITKLALSPSGVLAVRLGLSPLAMLELFFRFLAKLFESFPKRTPKNKEERP